MIKHRRAMALSGALVAAGCSGGAGSTPAPIAKPAQTTNLPLSTGHITINPTLLRHAASSQRRPAFVDGVGDANADPMFLVITSVSQQSDGTLLSPPATTVSVPFSSVSVQASVPLYGPGGFLRIKEVIGSIAPQITLADTDSDSESFDGVSGFGQQPYSIQPGSNAVTLPPITLNAVVGGIVFSDRPDGSGSNTVFVPNSLKTFPQFTVNPSGYVYAFPADAAGNFTNLTVPGGFPNPVVLGAFSFGDVFQQTSIPGAFFAQGCGGESLTVFRTTDIFGNVGSTLGSDVGGSGNGGYLLTYGGLVICG